MQLDPTETGSLAVCEFDDGTSLEIDMADTQVVMLARSLPDYIVDLGKKRSLPANTADDLQRVTGARAATIHVVQSLMMYPMTLTIQYMTNLQLLYRPSMQWAGSLVATRAEGLAKADLPKSRS